MLVRGKKMIGLNQIILLFFLYSLSKILSCFYFSKFCLWDPCGWNVPFPLLYSVALNRRGPRYPCFPRATNVLFVAGVNLSRAVLMSLYVLPDSQPPGFPQRGGGAEGRAWGLPWGSRGSDQEDTSRTPQPMEEDTLIAQGLQMFGRRGASALS